MTERALGPGSMSSQDLDGLLADLVLEDLTVAPATEIVITEEIHEALEEAVDAIEAYESQVVETSMSDVVEAPAEPAPAAAPSRKTGTARITADLASLPAEAFRLLRSGTVDDDHKAAVIKSRPLQKKVGEKFDNLIGAVAANRTPSVFVMIAFKVLRAKPEVVTADIVAALRPSYNEGTARSQAGQIMVLFDALGIAKRSGKTLTLNPESAFAEKLSLLTA